MKPSMRSYFTIWVYQIKNQILGQWEPVELLLAMSVSHYYNALLSLLLITFLPLNQVCAVYVPTQHIIILMI